MSNSTRQPGTDSDISPTWRTNGTDTLWQAHPQYEGRYEFAVRRPPPDPVETITTDTVTALVYRQRVFNFIVPWSEPTYYFTHFHWTDEKGKHSISRDDLVLFFDSFLEMWEGFHYLALDLTFGYATWRRHMKPEDEARSLNVFSAALDIAMHSDHWMEYIRHVSSTLCELSDLEHLGRLPTAWHPFKGELELEPPGAYKAPLKVNGLVCDHVFRLAEEFCSNGFPASRILAQHSIAQAERWCGWLSAHGRAPGWKRRVLDTSKRYPVLKTMDPLFAMYTK